MFTELFKFEKAILKCNVSTCTALELRDLKPKNPQPQITEDFGLLNEARLGKHVTKATDKIMQKVCNSEGTDISLTFSGHPKAL